MKYLMLDMDGTICAYYDSKDGKILMTEFPSGFFLNKKPLNSIITTVKELYKDYCIIIFSASPSGEANAEKEQWLALNGFADVPKIFLRYPNSDKGEALMRFMQLNNIEPSCITVLDDDIRVLRSCEKLGVHCVHPSYILSVYEDKHHNN